MRTGSGGGAGAVGAGEVSAASVGGVSAGICGSFRAGETFCDEYHCGPFPAPALASEVPGRGRAARCLCGGAGR